MQRQIPLENSVYSILILFSICPLTRTIRIERLYCLTVFKKKMAVYFRFFFFFGFQINWTHLVTSSLPFLPPFFFFFTSPSFWNAVLGFWKINLGTYEGEGGTNGSIERWRKLFYFVVESRFDGSPFPSLQGRLKGKRSRK